MLCVVWIIQTRAWLVASVIASVSRFRINGPGFCERPNCLWDVVKSVCCPLCLFLNYTVSNLLFNLTSVFVEKVKVV